MNYIFLKNQDKNQCALREFCYVRQQLLDLKEGSCSTEISWLSHGTTILPQLYSTPAAFLS